jgi:predicted O-methyltransferase YrrM
VRLKFIGRIYDNIARRVLEGTFYRLENDIEFHQRYLATQASARYVTEAMPQAEKFRDRDAMLKDAVRRSTAVPGCICEFGVWSGQTLRIMADAAPKRQVHGFDSFEGLPGDWRTGFAKGAFKTGVPTFTQRNVQLHKGWFDATLPAFIRELKEPIALAHIDCDLYASTRTVLEHIAPRLAPGAILVFDEYFGYPGWEQHEHRALLECVAARKLAVRYLAFNSMGEQVMVETQPLRAAGKPRKKKA